MIFLFSPRIFNQAAAILLCSLLLFTPFARGAIHPWARTVIVLAVLSLLTLLLLEKIAGRISLPIADNAADAFSAMADGRSAGFSFRKTALDAPFAALLSLVLLTSAFSLHKPDSGEAITLLLSYIALFYIVIYTVRTREQQRMLVYVIIGAAMLLALVGLLKRFDSLPVSWWQYPHQRAMDYMMTGPYGNHNHLAGYLEMSVPLLFGLFLTKSRRGAIFYTMICIAIFLVVAHVLTLSRGGWLSLSVSLAAMALLLLLQKRFRGKKMLALLLAGCFLLLLFILSGTQIVERILTLSEEETLKEMAGRTVAWQGVFEMIRDYPLWGTGPGTFATAFTQYQPSGLPARFFEAHNDYLHFVAETGLLLIPVVVWLVYTVLAAGLRKLASPSRQVWGITLGAMTGLLAILIHSASDFNLHIPANAVLFTVLAGLIFCRIEDRRKTG